MLRIEAAKNFIYETARPFEKAVYDVLYNHYSVDCALVELKKYQNEDGGFDISWKWYTPYEEFEQARIWWRPRVTLEKLLFVQAMKKGGDIC